ncbi:MAG: ferrochelatase [Hyphomicrobiales bacterium]|nr:MAG: ferrochelatase [Hyphomicrobiales bacterium]
MTSNPASETRREDMRAVRLPQPHPAVTSGKVGVLLVNLGTPDGTDYWSMRRYLKEFLSDRRVIETPRLIWWFVLNVIILTFRPKKSGEAYEQIWNKDLNESPLRTITRSQGEKLAADFKGDDRVVVDWAMRYGNPSIAERIAGLKDAGCDRLLVVPLYPQYAAATTATVNDAVFDVLKTMRWQPTLRIAAPYHDEPVYIDALAASIREHLAGLDFEPELILTSYHGIPKSYFDKGDPYHCHCQKTTRLLAEALGPDAPPLKLTFQSRFGPAEWLQPYTDETVKELARSGTKRLAAVMPGFSADCLETLEEIGGENAEYFHEEGGEHFSAIPCLNDSEHGMAVIRDIVRRELAGWI